MLITVKYDLDQLKKTIDLLLIIDRFFDKMNILFGVRKVLQNSFYTQIFYTVKIFFHCIKNF